MTMRPVTNREIGNFRIPPSVLDNWRPTRKAPRKLGSIFEHPRIFSTVGYRADRNWFIFALIIEAATILVSIFVIEFDFIYVSVACLVVAIDIIFAFLLHKPQDHINKLRCSIALNDYRGKTGSVDKITAGDIANGFEDEIKKTQRKKIFFIAVIILVAIVKSIGVMIALSDDDAVLLPYVIPILFCLTAYVHIKHTGYFLSEWYVFRRSFYKERKKYFKDMANLPDKNTDLTELVRVEQKVPLPNIPPVLKAELDALVYKIKVNKEPGRRFDEKREPKESSDFITLFKNDNNSNVRIVYDDSKNSDAPENEVVDTSSRYYLTSWGRILDDNLFDLVDGAGMNAELKSFIGYNGLLIQAQNFQTHD
ncbi:hypothetical protein [Mucilaginibacter flavidus]|uniref:hypothetical protein n=1 Tax=Mucilaginibacter flavidus TaxID=2949309 RepID=UPI0020930D7F|nr:hypothetical protein [Mucilaginibacter flavidus]MCO5945379.1 hypothetical protein [Mucilaginibacter flavidus]